jgi:hypothetical protein
MKAVAQAIVVLDDLYGLPVTSDGVGVLEGRSLHGQLTTKE